MNYFKEILSCFEDDELRKIAIAYADGYNCFNEDLFLFNMDSIIKELVEREKEQE